MSDAENTYAETLERLFDDPDDANASDAMLVVGDALESIGDPRGERIALSEAIARESSVARVRALKARLAEHTTAHASNLLGGLARYSWMRRTLDICWRGGVAYSARIDVRNTKKLGDISGQRYFELALAAPALKHLRRLSVRVRSSEGPSIIGVLTRTRPTLPLEEVLLGDEPRPARIMQRFRRSFGFPHTLPRDTVAFVEHTPRLWLLTFQRGAQLIPLDGRRLIEPVELAIDRLDALESDSADSRAQIGRGLWTDRPELRASAVRAIGRLGCAAAFRDSIRMMFRRGVIPDHEDLATAIGQLGAAGEPLVSILRTVSGHADHHRAGARSAAGRAIAAIMRVQ